MPILLLLCLWPLCTWASDIPADTHGRISQWLPTRDVDSPQLHPLILFSHGFGGSGTQSQFLCQALAQAGYVVLAIDHPDAMVGAEFAQQRGQWPTGTLEQILRERLARLGQPIDLPAFGQPDTWTADSQRARRDDILHLLDYARATPALSGIIDFSRVGLAGHSLGGYTVLGLSGGWPSWRDSRFACVLALSPYVQPYLAQGSLGGITVPIMYQGGTRDVGITPYLRGPTGAYAATTSPRYYVELDGAAHFAWTDFNIIYQPTIVTYSVAFFDRYLRGIHSPILSAPAAARVSQYLYDTP